MKRFGILALCLFATQAYGLGRESTTDLQSITSEMQGMYELLSHLEAEMKMAHKTKIGWLEFFISSQELNKIAPRRRAISASLLCPRF